jgi:hypothetical protein
MDLIVVSFCTSSSQFISSTKLDFTRKIDKLDIFSCVNDDLKSYFWGNFIYAVPEQILLLQLGKSSPAYHEHFTRSTNPSIRVHRERTNNNNVFPGGRGMIFDSFGNATVWFAPVD